MNTNSHAAVKKQASQVKKSDYAMLNEHLTQHFFNVGKPSNQRNANNSDWLAKTPSGHDHIRNSFIVLSLRKNLSISSKIIAKGGKPLVFHNYGKKVTTRSLKGFFTSVWPNGLISNFKRIGKKFKRLPNIAVIVVNENTKRLAIETEVTRTKINSFFVTSTNNTYAGLYTIFGNNDSPRSADFLNHLLIRAISVGLIQETSRIKVKKRFPRLGSNQRPRT